MRINIKPIFILFFLIFSGPVLSAPPKSLTGYTYIDFYDFVARYNTRNRNVVGGIYGEKKIDLNTTNFTTYIQPAEKYITFLEYRSTSRRVDIYQRPFLLNWFKMSHLDKNFSSEDTAESILADENFDLFYTATMYSARGKSYYILTQKPISDAMARDLKNGEPIQVYMWNLGQYSQDIPVFLIVGYEKAPSVTQAVQDQFYFQKYLPILKNDILSRRYDKASGNIDMLLKKYPGNLDLKLNQCLIYNQTNLFDKSITCYRDVIRLDSKNYDAYYGISMAYYNNPRLSQKVKSQNIVENTNKALELIQSAASSTSGSLAMAMYNSYYLRAMAKLEIGDKTAIDDLMAVYNNEPALVDSGSVEIFKKRLGI